MMFSKMFIPTMRDVPSDVEAVSHRLLLRAGFVRQLAAGLYIYLPLGWRVLNRVNRILKEEMDAIGAQEISMPVLHPAEVWQKTGRWQEIGEEMFRLKDRTGRDMCLGMTHEEIMTWLASREIRSYRDLPQVWYQIQTKLRDEARSRGGILRTREFIMKDSYSFDMDDDGLDRNYELHAGAYHRIFLRCGLTFHQVESDPGMMGGAGAHEFMAPTPAGEDEIVLCDACGYAANVEIARTSSPPLREQTWAVEELHTPDKRTVKEVSQFLQISPEYFIKSLLLITPGGPVLALIRGDQELHEKKMTRIVGQFRAAGKDEVLSMLGVEAGFIGPTGHALRKIGDLSLREGTYVTGANKPDFHMRGIQPSVHFEAEWHDIHVARAGDACALCGHAVRIEKAIEIGNIFKLGTKYSTALEALYLDREGQSRPVIMGSYGIGPARIAAAAVEQNNDKDGIVWPKSISPFDVEIIPLSVSDDRTMDVAASLLASLSERNLEVLVDDRDERPGVKFKDADLIGIPVHIIIGEKNLKDGNVEVKNRRTKEVRKVAVGNAAEETIRMRSEVP